MNRLDGPLDAVLHLLDRQVIDVAGQMVCKVDDVEITEHVDRSLVVTGLLVGASALLPRFSGRMGRSLLEQWRRLAVEQADRTHPWRIDMTDVAKLESDVHLTVRREGLLREHTGRSVSVHRLDQILGMDVCGPGRQWLGRVTDVRLKPHPRTGHLVCSHLVVGRGRPGSMLGYDRRPQMGPAILNRAIIWLHRHTGQLALSDVKNINWNEGTITCTAALKPLAASR